MNDSQSDPPSTGPSTSTSTSTGPSRSDKFRIAVIGSGPIGKLLTCSVASHPRIELVQYEQEVLPLRPSFGYGVGPQTLIAAKALNARLGDELMQRCFTSQTWMHWWHAGDEDCLIANAQVPEGKVFGRLGREELMTLLDDLLPDEAGSRRQDIHYDKRLVHVKQLFDSSSSPRRLELQFEDATTDVVDAIWAADGVNSLCRKLVQQQDYRAPVYSGFQAYRGKVDAAKVAELVGQPFADGTYMFVGVEGWHVLIFPIDNGRVTNIAAFCKVPDPKRFERSQQVSLDELLGHFPHCNAKIDTLLRLVHSDTPGGCQRLQITHMAQLGRLVNRDLCITTFGDAANAMTPHIAGSMSCGFIGCDTFLREEWNPRITSGQVPADASNDAIAEALMEASMAYEAKHLPLAQKLVDYSAEQGFLWSGGAPDVDELLQRPLFLWCAADDKPHPA